MCNFCKLELIDETMGEKETVTSIDKIVDGSLTFELALYRNIVERDNHRSNILIIDESVKFPSGDGLYPILSKEIKIKYCPFCGEEL